MPTPIPFPGGFIDGDRFSEGEIYIGTPAAAAVPPGCEIGEKYTTLVRTGQFEKIPDLFTDDAVITLTGQAIRGKAAIVEFYDTQVRRVRPQPIPVAYWSSPGLCLVQIAAARLIDGKVTEHFAASVSQFYLAEGGKASMMIAFGRRSLAVERTVQNFGR